MSVGLAALTLAACQLHKRTDKIASEQSVGTDSAQSEAQLDWTKAPHSFSIVAKDAVRGTQLLAEMQKPSCSDEAKAPLSLRVRIKSAFQAQAVRLLLRGPDETPVAELQAAAADESAAGSGLRARSAPPPPRGKKSGKDAKASLAQKSEAPSGEPPALEGRGVEEEIEAEADHLRMHLATNEPLFAPLRAAACAAKAEPGAQIELTVDAKLADSLRDIISRITPDCTKLESSGQGYDCQLPEIDPDSAKQELNGIRTTMLTRWSRQPYLLARRLAVGLSLAAALEARDFDRQLDTLCAVVKRSLPIELTATIASRRWQSAACEGPHPKRREAASFGLAKTIVEIDFLRQLFERSSKLGTLTLRIPDQLVPYQRIWVSLVPESDVAESLTRETARLWLTDANIAIPQPEDLPHSCWHPVYGESPRLMLLARHLTLAGDAANIACNEAPPTKPADVLADPRALARYIADSITSETEFVMLNRKTKTLRLPTGRYRYALRGLSDDPAEWDDAAQAEPQSSGVIEWDRRQPRPSIITW